MAKKLIHAASALLVSALLLVGCAKEAAPAPPPEFNRGVWDGDMYTSSYASVSFDLPSGWTVVPDAVLAGDMDLSAKDVVGTGMPFSEEMLALEEMNDMKATSPETDSFVVVGYTNLSIIGGLEFTEDDYLEYGKKELEESGELPGAVYGDYNRVKTMGGKKYTILEVLLEDYNVEIYIATRRIGDYMLDLTIFAAGGDSADDILEYFSFTEEH